MYTITYNNREYTITDGPNCENSAEGEVEYVGSALAANGHRIDLRWQLTEEYKAQCEAYNEYYYGNGEFACEPDEREACNWEEYEVIK